MVNYKIESAGIGLGKQDLDLIGEINEIRQNKGNLQTVRKTIGDKRLISLINKVYPKNDVKMIEKILKVPDSSLGYWFKQLGIETSRRHLSNSTVPANFDGSIIIRPNKDAANISAMNITEGLAYLIGFCIGDGTTEKFSIEVYNKDLGMKDYLKNVMKLYGKVKERIRPDGLWKLRLSSVKISDLIKRNKTIREETLEYILADNDLAARFLAGLWDAEGSVLRQGKYFHVYLYNSDKQLIDKVLEYLKGIGMETSILKMPKRNKPYEYNGRFIVAIKTIYRIGIPKRHFKQWAENIGIHLKHSKKCAMVRDILTEGD
ncbi:LAGLIDADG-like domain protein [uncultured archaeon]|nr:LAGLIDADG-like domain protein [uncultured archaeon]